jgi:hypothetical protein
MNNDLNALLSEISQLDGQLTAQAAKSIDRLLTIRNWLIGGYLFEYEQNGSDRANYGSKLELTIAESLNRKGLSERNLKLFKQFYVVYPQIMQTVSAQFSIPEKIERTTSALSPSSIGSGDDISKLIDNLFFSHLTELMKITNKDKRQFYEIQAIKGTWSVRDLRRQINILSAMFRKKMIIHRLVFCCARIKTMNWWSMLWEVWIKIYLSLLIKQHCQVSMS